MRQSSEGRSWHRREEALMKWVTREKARVDRIACPWLISRFIDKQAVFLFLPAPEVMAVGENDGGSSLCVPGIGLVSYRVRVLVRSFIRPFWPHLTVPP